MTDTPHERLDPWKTEGSTFEMVGLLNTVSLLGQRRVTDLEEGRADAR
jgi:hypothetical protein